MTKIEQIWIELQDDARIRPIAEGSYKLLRIDPSAHLNVFAGLDSTGCVLLSIGIAASPPPLQLESDSLDYFRQRRSDGTWLMALRLKQAELSGVFGRLCQDLVDAMSNVPNEAALVALFRDRLSLWKKLFDQGRGGLLEPHRVKGLIAELLVLEATLHAGRRSVLEATTAWVGPSRADQDFQFSDEAIEVKAVGLGAECISISSLQQLDAAVPLRICVYTMRPASPDEAGSIGLNILVPRVESYISSFPDALSLFRRSLLEAGYVENSYYDSVQFQPMAIEHFRITATSPRLTMATVPRGVAAASYSLSLNFLRNSN